MSDPSQGYPMLGSLTWRLASLEIAPTQMSEPEVEELKRLRRRVKQLPPGFSQDPPVEEGPTTYCCNYTPPAVEQLVVRRNFTKGAGLTADVLGISLRQPASARDAELALGGVG